MSTEHPASSPTATPGATNSADGGHGAAALDLDALRAVAEDYAAAYEDALHGKPNRMPDIAHKAMEALPALIAEVQRVHTWAGFMELLDEHWPADTFPTLTDDPARDAGPRLVAALRRAEKAEAERDAWRQNYDHEHERRIAVTNSRNDLIAELTRLREGLAAATMAASEWSRCGDSCGCAKCDLLDDLRDLLAGGEGQ